MLRWNAEVLTSGAHRPDRADMLNR